MRRTRAAPGYEVVGGQRWVKFAIDLQGKAVARTKPAAALWPTSQSARSVARTQNLPGPLVSRSLSLLSSQRLYVPPYALASSLLPRSPAHLGRSLAWLF